jgi:hypothetical protein
VKERDVLPVVIDACVAAATQLAAVAAMPPDEDPAVAMKRRDLEQLVALAQRNSSLQPAVVALQQEIDAMATRPRPSPDADLISGMINDPFFFSEGSAEAQRTVFGSVLSSVQVARGGAARAVRRSW